MALRRDARKELVMNDEQPHFRKTIVLDSRDEAVLLSGPRDSYLKLVRDVLGIRVLGRGDIIELDSVDEINVGRGERVFTQMRSILRTQGKVTQEDVKTCLEVVRAGTDSNKGAAVTMLEGGKYLRPRTDGQGRYVAAMRENDMTIAIGPAGTGKTFMAVGMAVTMLRQGLVKKIVLVRPAVEAGERLGFLPGDLEAKINPYLRPLFDALHDMLDINQVRRYMEDDIIEIAPLAFMRGRTLNNACIIMDEGQNTTVPQMKMFLTRMGNNSKVIVTGDPTQIDLPPTMKSGLIDALQRLRDVEGVSIVRLDDTDIVRHPLVSRIVQAYDDTAPPKGKR
jgi:phosphate starvation-inducible protein PhoH and related proteins